MASQFSQQLIEKIDQGDGVLVAMQRFEYEGLVDAELAEVREVLLSTSKHKDAYGMPCWCEVMMRTLPHIEDCQRARALYEKLRTDK